MKKGLCIAGILVLAAQVPLWGYDRGVMGTQVIPEVIWAAATGGGTWLTEVQVTNIGTTSASLTAYFYYAGGQRGPITLHVGLEPYHTLRSSNILSELQTLDPSFDYYGRVGALIIATPVLIQTQAKTVNGNYGKTFPGLSPLLGDTLAVGQPMIIQDLVHNATYRTFVGLFNAGPEGATVMFTIIDADDVPLGSFTKTLNAGDFISFNPFVQAGISSGSYENCWLHLQVVSAGGGDIVSYGSAANNFTNDTYALLPKMFN